MVIYSHAAAGIVGAVLAGLLSWNVQAWRYDAQISSIQAQHSRALADAHQKALDDTIKLQRIKDAAIEKAEQRAKQNAVAAAAARANADSLRAQLDGVPARISRATDSAVREYAHASSVVFAECVRSYQELAAAADGHAADVRLMLEAWPK
jgi:regulator of protease activity HflC (stomatin/prohibitin superfamily)